MWKQLFATMHDVLDEVNRQYATADAAGKQDLHKKLEVLKTMSDSFIEEWLKFEEKMSQFTETQEPGCVDSIGVPALPAASECRDAFNRGQGYFQLLMYEDAIREFEEVVSLHPDYAPARLYLAMGHLRNGNDMEAYRHFRFITSLTEHVQMKAISYNAMGCIQAKNANLEQARQLFKQAYMTDPSCVEPMINMGICLSQGSEPGLSAGPNP